MSSLNRSRGSGSDISLATPKMPRRPIVVDLDDMQELSTRDLRVSMSSRVPFLSLRPVRSRTCFIPSRAYCERRD